MKQIVFYAVAVGLLLGAGCKKKEQPPVEMTEQPKVVEAPQQAPAQPTVSEAPAATTETESISKTLTDQAKAAAGAMTVKAEDVMAELNQSVDEIKQKIASYDKSQLLAYTDQYKALIQEKKDEVAALTDQLKGLSITEMMGETGKTLKSQISQYSDQIAALTDRYAVYLDALTQTGAASDASSAEQ